MDEEEFCLSEYIDLYNKIEAINTHAIKNFIIILKEILREQNELRNIETYDYIIERINKISGKKLI